jgi:hypothetical protein
MVRKPVISGMIKSVGYDSTLKVLEIEFNSGAIYQYTLVSVDVYISFINAISLASFFHSNIRGKYLTTRIS